MDYEPSLYTKRWIAYFDLLGVKHLFQSGNWTGFVNAMFPSVDELADQNSRNKNITVAWFSDTFILYAVDDSPESFNAVAEASCLFFSSRLETFIPLRGAIACDSFYADHVNNIYFGEGLIEAHKYGEAQNWIGFVMCPSAKKQLDELDEQDELLSRYGFVPTNIPYKNCKQGLLAWLGTWMEDGLKEIITNLKKLLKTNDDPKVTQKYRNTTTNCRQGLACMLGTWMEDGLKEIITNLKRMRKKNDDPKVDQKYKNSIAFFEKFID